MRKATGLLTLCGAALVVGAAASAQTPTTIVDTYGDGTNWNVGAGRTNGAAVGSNAEGGGGTGLAPADPTKAAYAVLPFTVNALPTGQNALDSIDIVFDILPAAGTNSNISALTGAIFAVPAFATALNSAGVVQVGSSFKFDTSFSGDPLLPNLGSNKTQLLTTVNAGAAGITFTPGKTYWLVIEPKNGLNPAASDTLLDWGYWIARTSAQITGSAATLTNSYTNVTQALDTYSAANAGDANTLQAVVSPGRTPIVEYFGARIRVKSNAATATVTGQIAIEGVSKLSAINSSIPKPVIRFDFRTPNTTNVVYTTTATLTPVGSTAFGTYTLTGVPAGTYDVAIKGDKQLRVLIANVTVSGTTTLVNETLPNGDADNNNTVDIGDFGILVNAYGSDVAVSGSGYNAAADFNYDGVVDIGDFGILVNEYGNTGAN